MAKEKMDKLKQAQEQFWQLPEIQKQVKAGNEIKMDWNKGRELLKQLLSEFSVVISESGVELDLKLKDVRQENDGEGNFKLTVDFERVSGSVAGVNMPEVDDLFRVQAKAKNTGDGVGFALAEAKLEAQSLMLRPVLFGLKQGLKLTGVDIDSTITNGVRSATGEEMQEKLGDFIMEGINKPVKNATVLLRWNGVTVKWEDGEVKGEKKAGKGGRMEGEDMTAHFEENKKDRKPLGVHHVDEVIAIKIDSKEGNMLEHFESHWKDLTKMESGWKPFVAALDNARSQVDVNENFDGAVIRFKDILVDMGADDRIAGEHAKLLAMALKMEKDWPDNKIVKLLKLVVLPVELIK